MWRGGRAGCPTLPLRGRSIRASHKILGCLPYGATYDRFASRSIVNVLPRRGRPPPGHAIAGRASPPDLASSTILCPRLDRRLPATRCLSGIFSHLRSPTPSSIGERGPGGNHFRGSAWAGGRGDRERRSGSGWRPVQAGNPKRREERGGRLGGITPWRPHPLAKSALGGVTPRRPHSLATSLLGGRQVR
jgi:hypothetical protein